MYVVILYHLTQFKWYHLRNEGELLITQHASNKFCQNFSRMNNTPCNFMQRMLFLDTY